MPQEYLYRCPSVGPVNNGLKRRCCFKHIFVEGPHNCPLCGSDLIRVSSGPTVAEILRRGQQEEAARQKKGKE